MAKDKFSVNLKNLRNEKGITQKQLSDILQVNQRTIAHLENNYRRPSYNLLIAIAEYFNISIDYLVGRTDNSKIYSPTANYKGETEIKSSNENFEKKRAFIQNSFKLPLFNDEMEKELKHITDWICTQQISEIFINIINDIIMEAIQINKELCINTDFNECIINSKLKYGYDISNLNYFSRISRRDFTAVNKKIKTINFEFSAERPFFTKHTENVVRYSVRKIFYLNSNNDLYKNFLHRFLSELYRANHFLRGVCLDLLDEDDLEKIMKMK